MINHVWSVLCSGSVIDFETNSVSIHEVIEQIQINDEPQDGGVLPIPLEIISLWERTMLDTPAEGYERVLFETPSGKSKVASEAKIDLSVAKRHRQRVKFPGLMVSESGRYYFKVELRTGDEWQQVAAVPLIMMFETPTK